MSEVIPSQSHPIYIDIIFGIKINRFIDNNNNNNNNIGNSLFIWVIYYVIIRLTSSVRAGR